MISKLTQNDTKFVSPIYYIIKIDIVINQIAFSYQPIKLLGFQKRVTHYEKTKGEKPNLKQLRIISLKAWINILEKLRKKLNNKAW